MTIKRNKITFLVLLAGFILALHISQAGSAETFCNPLDLNYRFMSDAADAREAADPVIVLFKDDYYLFASRSGGYWYSNDMRSWNFVVIPTSALPIIETYAPAVFVIGDTMYYTASVAGRLYKSADPKGGVWIKGDKLKSYGDPALFLDDDGRVFMYHGLSNVTPTWVVELRPDSLFVEKGAQDTIVTNNAATHGWERRGDDNLLDEQPWIEGSWMNKHNGIYYLQYAAPGTEFKTYADGIYTATDPLGPYSYASYSPFSFKPTGFITGAGHGSTFRDKEGRYWRIVTSVISIKHMFERRLSLYPVGFDTDNVIHTNTAFGDYPQFYPGVKETPETDNFAGFMLLSRLKEAQCSSVLKGYSLKNAVDNDIKTYWCAETGNAGEWMQLDLGKVCHIQAIQVNLGEHGTTPKLVRGRTVQVYEQYHVDVSNDGVEWQTIIDKSENLQDIPHYYTEIDPAVDARFVRIVNVFTPGEGKFAVRDLRVFGNSAQAMYTPITDFTVERSEADGRDAVIRWNPVENSDGYIIRFGTAPTKLYNNYMVYDADSVAIHSLNHGVEYFFSVEAFDSGTDYYYGNYPDNVQAPLLKPASKFELEQNYPNPFNPVTNITWSLPAAGDVTVQVFNLLGELVYENTFARQSAGVHHLAFDCSGLASGIYIYRVKSGAFMQQKKMMLLK
ncbi:MAG TPA: family 43 glycosylhydrolase [bacterium]|nr:family 43 glycosylhydrolase [bacterium]HPN45661.1 family 43 glycosylhydrolase [bacterium]